jgi:hypothetical protein
MYLVMDTARYKKKYNTVSSKICWKQSNWPKNVLWFFDTIQFYLILDTRHNTNLLTYQKKDTIQNYLQILYHIVSA